jgi:WD40 repeat protein
LIAASGRDGKITIWDRHSQEVLEVLPSSASGLAGIAFNPDGARIAGATARGFTKVWDLPAVRLETTVTGRMTSAQLSPDGAQILVTGTDNGATVFDARNGGLVQAAKDLSASTLTGAFAPDAQHFATGGLDGVVRIWNRVDGSLVASLRGATNAINQVVYDSRGTRLAAASWDHNTWIWNLADAEATPLGIGFKKARAFAVAFNSAGTSIAVGSDETETDQGARILIANLSSLSRTSEITLPPHSTDVTRLAYSPDDRYLIAGFSDGLLAIWDLTSGKQSPNLLAPGHESSISNLRFSGDGKLASASLDGATKVWNVAKRGMLFAMHGHTGAVYGLSFATTAGQLTTVGADGIVLRHLLEWTTVEQTAQQTGRNLTDVECQDYFQGKSCPSFPFPIAATCQ